ncbi:MAG: serine/threonine protein kinase [Chloroflexota bacterium]|nr:serine/threonine protein kinase [Chloroflexota bacterium]
MLTLEGTKLDHYQILSRLGRGGMSEVYLAHDEHTDRDVAIKVVNSSSNEQCERFRYEVAALSLLRHEHILPVLDHGEQNPWCYLVMPHIQGGTLREHLKLASKAHNGQGWLTPEEAGVILEQVAAALQFAHEHGIIHRDIKPSNILLQMNETAEERDTPHIYLADFGLAKKVETGHEITATGCLIGTPDYMAPELAEELPSPASDVYALGVVLYQMLTGQVPFKGPTPLAIYWKHIHDKPARPSTLNPSISRPIEQVILRAMEKDPRRRFRTARDLAHAYQNALESSHMQNTVLLPLGASLHAARTHMAAASSASTSTLTPYRLPLMQRRASGYMVRGTIAAVAAFGILAGSALSLSNTFQHPIPLAPIVIGAGAQAIANSQPPTQTPATQPPTTQHTQHKPVTTNNEVSKPIHKAQGNHGNKSHGHGHGHGHGHNK